jgi:hypothetical protein
MLEQGDVPNDLNLRTSQRIAAGLAPLSLVALPALPLALATGAGSLTIACLLVLAASVALQRDFIAEFARLRGPGFAARACVFHQVHLTYSAVTFAVCWMRHRLRASKSSA